MSRLGVHAAALGTSSWRTCLPEWHVADEARVRGPCFLDGVVGRAGEEELVRERMRVYPLSRITPLECYWVSKESRRSVHTTALSHAMRNAFCITLTTTRARHIAPSVAQRGASV